MANGNFEYWAFENIKCAGMLYEYTDAKITKITYLGTNEEPINAAKNISSITYNEVSLDNIKKLINKNTECNNFIKESYFDTKNNPILIDGYHSSYLGNNNGEKIIIFTDINDKLVMNTNKDYGCAYLIYKYKNPFTNEDEITYYGVNNENILNSFEYYKRINKYDDKGINIISSKYYDTENKPTFLSNHFYKVEFEYDNFENFIYKKFYNINNKIIIDNVNKYAISH